MQLDPAAPRVTVRHTIVNRGLWPVEVYPWGLTQLKPGGHAILPQWPARLDRHGVQPNRALALWPYTKVNDPRLMLGDRYVRVHSDPANGESFKIGYANLRGWLAYHRDGTLFVKHAPYQFAARYADLGSSVEVYTNDRFIELEDMAPLRTLDTCDSSVLVETWRVFRDVPFDGSEESATPWPSGSSWTGSRREITARLDCVH